MLPKNQKNKFNPGTKVRKQCWLCQPSSWELPMKRRQCRIMVLFLDLRILFLLISLSSWFLSFFYRSQKQLVSDYFLHIKRSVQKLPR